MVKIKKGEIAEGSNREKFCYNCQSYEINYIRNHVGYMPVRYGYCYLLHEIVMRDAICDRWRERDVRYPNMGHKTEMRLRRLLDELGEIYNEIYGGANRQV